MFIFKPVNKILLPLSLILLLALLSLAYAQDNTLKFKLKPGAQGKLCVNCHPTFADKLKLPSVHTPVKKGECVGCHNPHTSSYGKLLATDAGKICNTCHNSLVPENAVSIHKPVAEHNCGKCHDPHAAVNKFNLITAGNELCYGCHKSMGEVISKVKFKHNPVEKGCITCHDPHASAKFPDLLKNSGNALCLGCHKIDKPVFIKQHMNYPVGKSRCTSCHNPHGSDQPGILYDNVHSPVAKKMCNQCHDDSAGADPLKIKKSGAELCRGCHNEMVNDMFGKDRVHWAVLGKEACLSCHTPHASPAKGLLKAPMITLCATCHADTIKRQEHSLDKHQPIANGLCTACHNPHASNSQYLAKKATIVDLCGTCHDWQKHSTHPIGEKFKDPRNPNLTVQCLSCHRSHGTEYKKFIPYATVSELCTQCHSQYKR